MPVRRARVMSADGGGNGYKLEALGAQLRDDALERCQSLRFCVSDSDGRSVLPRLHGEIPETRRNLFAVFIDVDELDIST